MTYYGVIAGIFCIFWILMFVYLMWVGRRITNFHKQQPQQPKQWPRLSIIVPACNEADHIREAVHSILAQDYPDLEIILVNDRSTDNTGKVIDSLAAGDRRIQAVHIQSLPEGWLGKVHAMDQGTRRASGEWLLYTDADIHYHDRVLRKAISYVLSHRIDHLAMVPRMIVNSYWLQLAITTFGLLFFVSSRGAVVNTLKRRMPIGIGAFNLVRKKVFDKTPGFEWLRLEVVDDVGLGLMVKNAGGNTHFAMAEQDLSLNWYPSLVAMFRGLEKNIFGAGAHYQVWRLMLLVALCLSLLAAPWLALLSADPVLWWLGVTAIGIHVFFSLLFVRTSRWESLYLLSFPLGLLLMSAMMLWSGFQCVRNRGIDWRGTHYPVEALKQGQRVRL